jgi:hypothetical protein
MQVIYEPTSATFVIDRMMLKAALLPIMIKLKMTVDPKVTKTATTVSLLLLAPTGPHTYRCTEHRRAR